MTKRFWRWVIIVQATIALLGSLYFSNFGDPIYNIWMGYGLFGASTVGFDPCTLCRYARILMYPLVWFGIYGMMTDDHGLARVIGLVSIAGICLELYHYVLQMTSLETNLFCTGANPCDAMSVMYGGFVTIPFMCLVAFVVIGIASYQLGNIRS